METWAAEGQPDFDLGPPHSYRGLACSLVPRSLLSVCGMGGNTIYQYGAEMRSHPALGRLLEPGPAWSALRMSLPPALPPHRAAGLPKVT